MADVHPETLEQRLTTLEAELQQAKERVRAFEDWRRRATRVCFLVMGGVVALLVFVSQTVPATGSGPSTVKAPFTIVNASGKKLIQFIDGKGGGVMNAYDHSGAVVATIGSTTTGDGGVSVTSGDQKSAAGLHSTNAEGPGLLFFVGKTAIAALTEGNSPGVQVVLQLSSQAGPAAQLEVNNETGKLVLSDGANNIRVEAGTEQNGNGAVKVAGPTGKCYPGFVGIPCMIVGH